MMKWLLLLFTIFFGVSSSFNWISTKVEQRGSMSAASVGNKAYFVGGFIRGSPSSNLTIFTVNSVTNKIRSDYYCSQALFDAGIATMGDLVIVAGGSTLDYIDTRYFMVINTTSNTNTTDLNGLPSPKSGRHSTTALNNRLFVTGPADSNIDIWYRGNSSWKSEPLTTTTYSISKGVAISNGKFALFAGGYYEHGRNGFVFPETITIYNTETNTRSTDNTLSIPRHSMAAVAIAQYIIFAGGVEGDRDNPDLYPSDQIDPFDVSNNPPISSPSVGRQLSAARYNIMATATSTLAFFAGGWFSTEFVSPSTKIDIFNSQTFIWRTENLDVASADGSAVSIGGRFVMIWAEDNLWLVDAEPPATSTSVSTSRPPEPTRTTSPTFTNQASMTRSVSLASSSSSSSTSAPSSTLSTTSLSTLSSTSESSTSRSSLTSESSTSRSSISTQTILTSEIKTSKNRDVDVTTYKWNTEEEVVSASGQKLAVIGLFFMVLF
eukprot:TRINITY_DN10643_c0_g1_i1.p1 TRINITY_DN10643_c0_g1~~TRINITY_DN10643_c0_g1_i1.p1  ORF type:complete len:492 (+),score=71.48 TRINITY_DN10643_c0_g1_i1:1-1476(+)